MYINCIYVSCAKKYIEPQCIKLFLVYYHKCWIRM